MVVRSSWWWGLTILLGLCVPALGAGAADLGVRADFRIKYVASGVVYLAGGRNAGLREGLELTVKRIRPAEAGQEGSPGKRVVVIGKIKVISVAEVSSVCEIVSKQEDIAPGDFANLDEKDAETVTEQNAISGARKYPQVITFTEGDPLEEEAREFVPKPPLPEINRSRGLIGFEYGGIQTGGLAPGQTTQLGLILRADVTRIGGSYWNLSGYWRGRVDTGPLGPGQQSLDQLINRTYHMSMQYANPNSPWVAGFGRLYLPWATSLDTLDGGYFGRKVAKGVTTGFFAGTTPDPSSWNYNPDRRMAGGFVNFEGGSYDNVKYTSTLGVGVSTLGWRAERQFFFLENAVFYKQYLSIYHSLQADEPHVPNPTTPGTNSPGIQRSYLTIRVQPIKRLSFDVNHNYFRDFPTFDPLLVGTGLVDKILFQGLSVGSRVELPKHLAVYTAIGRNNQSQDTRPSWNKMFGFTMGQIWRTGIRGDIRYSKFDNTFGRGNYTLLSLSRNFGDSFRWEFTTGKQNYISPLTNDSRYRTLGTTIDWFPGKSLYFDFGFNRNHGTILNYNQWYMGIGYRFDSYRGRHHEAPK